MPLRNLNEIIAKQQETIKNLFGGWNEGIKDGVGVISNHYDWWIFPGHTTHSQYKNFHIQGTSPTVAVAARGTQRYQTYEALAKSEFGEGFLLTLRKYLRVHNFNPDATADYNGSIVCSNPARIKKLLECLIEMSLGGARQIRCSHAPFNVAGDFTAQNNLAKKLLEFIDKSNIRSDVEKDPNYGKYYRKLQEVVRNIPQQAAPGARAEASVPPPPPPPEETVPSLVLDLDKDVYLKSRFVVFNDADQALDFESHYRSFFNKGGSTFTTLQELADNSSFSNAMLFCRGMDDANNIIFQERPNIIALKREGHISDGREDDLHDLNLGGVNLAGVLDNPSNVGKKVVFNFIFKDSILGPDGVSRDQYYPIPITITVAAKDRDNRAKHELSCDISMYPELLKKLDNNGGVGADIVSQLNNPFEDLRINIGVKLNSSPPSPPTSPPPPPVDYNDDEKEFFRRYIDRRITYCSDLFRDPQERFRFIDSIFQQNNREPNFFSYKDDNTRNSIADATQLVKNLEFIDEIVGEIEDPKHPHRIIRDFKFPNNPKSLHDIKGYLMSYIAEGDKKIVFNFVYEDESLGKFYAIPVRLQPSKTGGRCIFSFDISCYPSAKYLEIDIARSLIESMKDVLPEVNFEYKVSVRDGKIFYAQFDAKDLFFERIKSGNPVFAETIRSVKFDSPILPYLGLNNDLDFAKNLLVKLAVGDYESVDEENYDSYQAHSIASNALLFYLGSGADIGGVELFKIKSGEPDLRMRKILKEKKSTLLDDVHDIKRVLTENYVAGSTPRFCVFNYFHFDSNGKLSILPACVDKQKKTIELILDGSKLGTNDLELEVIALDFDNKLKEINRHHAYNIRTSKNNFVGKINDNNILLSVIPVVDYCYKDFPDAWQNFNSNIFKTGNSPDELLTIAASLATDELVIGHRKNGGQPVTFADYLLSPETEYNPATDLKRPVRDIIANELYYRGNLNYHNPKAEASVDSNILPLELQVTKEEELELRMTQGQLPYESKSTYYEFNNRSFSDSENPKDRSKLVITGNNIENIRRGLTKEANLKGVEPLLRANFTNMAIIDLPDNNFFQIFPHECRFHNCIISADLSHVPEALLRSLVFNNCDVGECKLPTGFKFERSQFQAKEDLDNPKNIGVIAPEATTQATDVADLFNRSVRDARQKSELGLFG